MSDYKGLSAGELISVFSDQLIKKKYDLCNTLGIFSLLMYDKRVFKRNIEVSVFFKDATGVEFPNYVVSSRTLMLARGIKVLYTFDEEQILLALDKAVKFLREVEVGNDKKGDTSTNKKRKNENKKLETWMKGL